MDFGDSELAGFVERMGLQMTFGKSLKMTAFGGARDFHARVWAK